MFLPLLQDELDSAVTLEFLSVRSVDLRSISASRKNCMTFRITSRKVSKISSPLAEQPEKKMTMSVMTQKTVIQRSSQLNGDFQNCWAGRMSGRF